MNQIDIQSPEWNAFSDERSSLFSQNLDNEGFDYEWANARLAARYGWTLEQVEEVDERTRDVYWASILGA